MIFDEKEINQEYMNEGNPELDAFSNDTSYFIESLLINYKMILLRTEAFWTAWRSHDGPINSPKNKKIKRAIVESLSKMESAIALLLSIYKDKPYEHREMMERVHQHRLLYPMILHEQILHFEHEELRRVTQFINWYCLQRIRELEGEESYKKALQNYAPVDGESIPVYSELDDIDKE